MEIATSVWVNAAVTQDGEEHHHIKIVPNARQAFICSMAIAFQLSLVDPHAPPEEVHAMTPVALAFAFKTAMAYQSSKVLNVRI